MKLKKVVSMGALILSSSAAMAGYVASIGVTIEFSDSGGGHAYGSMSGARFSDDENEAIGCGVRRYGGNNPHIYGFCNAIAPSGTPQVSCYTENPDLIESLATLSDYSFITFAWNADGECMSIGVSTQSQYIPAI